jgi:hypothetical protein
VLIPRHRQQKQALASPTWSRQLKLSRQAVELEDRQGEVHQLDEVRVHREEDEVEAHLELQQVHQEVGWMVEAARQVHEQEARRREDSLEVQEAHQQVEQEVDQEAHYQEVQEVHEVRQQIEPRVQAGIRGQEVEHHLQVEDPVVAQQVLDLRVVEAVVRRHLVVQVGKEELQLEPKQAACP